MAGETSWPNNVPMPNETPNFTTPRAHIESGAQRLAYWRFGSGPDIVMVHGWPLHSATFRHIVPELAKHFTLHLFDLPGVGQSEAHGPVSFTSHAAAVRAATEKLGLTRYALLAHDSGGLIARLMAADDARVCGLVLGGTEIPGHHPPLFEAYVRMAKLPGFGALLLSTLRIGFLRRSPLGFGGCFTDARYADGEFADLFVKPLLASRRAAEGHLALLRSVDFAFVDALAAVHARIRAPVLCVWGTQDPFFPIAKARRMIGEFGGDAELVQIDGAKLFAHEDHPEAFVAQALPFLERVMASKETLSSAGSSPR
jgi:haloalkane dehalogenase